ncbi:MAG TPA: hypothetical protein DIT82_05235, partial [Bifidobacterium longum]|nr:hypothetical protein [Bifidobacterium longum]
DRCSGPDFRRAARRDWRRLRPGRRRKLIYGAYTAFPQHSTYFSAPSASDGGLRTRRLIFEE